MNSPVKYTMTITLSGVLLCILTLQPIATFDVIQILDRWIFGGSSTHKKYLLNIEAQNEFIVEREFLRSTIRTLQQDADKIRWDIEKWKNYHRDCNFIMYMVVNWILSTLDYRGAQKDEHLKDLIWRRDYEPFCEQYHHSGAYHTHHDLICEKAFQDQFFTDRKWTLSSHGESKCKSIDIRKIETNAHSEHDEISHNRWARRCPAYDEAKKLEFNVYLAASMHYKPNKGILSYYVLLDNDLRLGTATSSRYYKFSSDRKEIAAYIEK